MILPVLPIGDTGEPCHAGKRKQKKPGGISDAQRKGAGARVQGTRGFPAAPLEAPGSVGPYSRRSGILAALCPHGGIRVYRFLPGT